MATPNLELTVDSLNRKFKINKNSKKLNKFWFIESFEYFCQSTNLHGFIFLSKVYTTNGERKFWAVVVIAAIIAAIVLLYISYNWNEKTPTVTTIESLHFFNWNLPFPAITICNLNKISKQRAQLVAKKLQIPSDQNLTQSELMNLFPLIYIKDVSGSKLNFSDPKYEQLNKILKFNNLTMTRLGRQLTPNCIDMILKCIWKSIITQCDTLFQRINTSEGVCCSYNYYGIKRMNYPMKILPQISPFPKRVSGSGWNTALTVILAPQTTDYFATYLSISGFRVMLHNPYDFPDDTAENKIITAMRESFIRITPESTYGSEDIRSLEPYTRNCYFPDELKLGLMTKYSYINCLAECRSLMYYHKCECVPSYLPNNGTLPYCDIEQLECYIKYRNLISGALPGVDRRFINGVSVESHCDCLPDCDLITYRSELTSALLVTEDNYGDPYMFKDIKSKDPILLHVYYGDLVATHYRKDLYQNWIAVLASFGGLLSLVMGFSFVTAFEFVYMIFIRPFINSFFKNQRQTKMNFSKLHSCYLKLSFKPQVMSGDASPQCNGSFIGHTIIRHTQLSGTYIYPTHSFIWKIVRCKESIN